MLGYDLGCQLSTFTSMLVMDIGGRHQYNNSAVKTLRVVQPQSISILKSLSERVESDIERHRILNDYSYLYRLKIDLRWRH